MEKVVFKIRPFTVYSLVDNHFKNHFFSFGRQNMINKKWKPRFYIQVGVMNVCRIHHQPIRNVEKIWKSDFIFHREQMVHIAGFVNQSIKCEVPKISNLNLLYHYPKWWCHNCTTFVTIFIITNYMSDDIMNHELKKTFPRIDTVISQIRDQISSISHQNIGTMALDIAAELGVYLLFKYKDVYLSV